MSYVQRKIKTPEVFFFFSSSLFSFAVHDLIFTLHGSLQHLRQDPNTIELPHDIGWALINGIVSVISHLLSLTVHSKHTNQPDKNRIVIYKPETTL